MEKPTQWITSLGSDQIFWQDENGWKRVNMFIKANGCDSNTMSLYMRLATRFSCWDVLWKKDVDFWGSRRFPSETLLTTLRGLFSSKPGNRHQRKQGIATQLYNVKKWTKHHTVSNITQKQFGVARDTIFLVATNQSEKTNPITFVLQHIHSVSFNLSVLSLTSKTTHSEWYSGDWGVLIHALWCRDTLG